MAKPKWRQDFYKPKNPEKYVGDKIPYLKSSWEFTFADFCDSNPSVKSWAYEPVKIPYLHPIKRTAAGKPQGSIYMPDFLIEYVDKAGKSLVELVEIKPASQVAQTPKTSKADRLHIILNHAKWKAAEKWCRHHQIRFRILTREEIYVK